MTAWLREWLPLLPVVERRKQSSADTGQRRRLTDPLEDTIDRHSETVQELVAYLHEQKKDDAP